MTDMSNYLENALINHVLRNTAMTSPTTVYGELYTALTDAEAGTGTEVSTSGTAYARQAMAFDAPSNGVTQNSAIVTYPTATASWGTISHAAIGDNVTVGSGNRLSIIKALSTGSKIIGNTDIFRFPQGSVTFTFA